MKIFTQKTDTPYSLLIRKEYDMKDKNKIKYRKNRTQILAHRIAKIFEQFTCHHEYEKIGFREEVDSVTNTRYSLRHYRCLLCNKDVWIDGRYDTINASERMR